VNGSESLKVSIPRNGGIGELAVRDSEQPVVGWNFHPLDLPEGVGREMVLTFLEGKYLIDGPEGRPEI